MSDFILATMLLIMSASFCHAQELLWSETYRDSGDYLRIVQASDGGFIVVGETTLEPTTVRIHGYLMRTTDQGKLKSDNVLHYLLWGGPRFILRRDARSCFLVETGQGYTVGVNTVDTSGELMTRALTPNNNDTCLFGDTRATADGGFVTVRSSVDSRPGNISAGDVIKFDRNGSVQWHRKYHPSAFYMARAVRQLSDGGIVVVGVGGDMRTGLGVCVTRFDEHGDSLWSKVIASETSDDAIDVVERSDGGLLIAGQSSKDLGPFMVGGIQLRGANDEVRPMLIWLDRATGVQERRSTFTFSGRPVQIERAIGGGYLISFRWGGVDIVKVDDGGAVIWQQGSMHFTQGFVQHFLPLADGRIVYVSSQKHSCMRMTMIRDTTAAQ